MLADVAGMLGRRGDAVGAAELFGAAQVLRGADVVLWGLGERCEYERNIRLVRAQLDESQLAAAWAAGQQFTLGEAVAQGMARLTGE